MSNCLARSVPEPCGAHARHIQYSKSRWGVTLNPASDIYGTGAAAAVCGVCHSNLRGDHMGYTGQPPLHHLRWEYGTAFWRQWTDRQWKQRDILVGQYEELVQSGLSLPDVIGLVISGTISHAADG
ncbi:MAG: hypothetical protein Fur0034_13990 [Desulfuromonadia bacterium]